MTAHTPTTEGRPTVNPQPSPADPLQGVDYADARDATSPAAGAGALDLIAAYLARFVTYPSHHAHAAHVLWCAHTHLLDVFDTTPRLVFTSADPGSGKSRALELTELFAHNAVHSVGGSTAWMVRTGSTATGTTMLVDEYDTVFALGRNASNEYMRSILNAGHRRGPKVGRVDKLPNGGMQPVQFDPFGAVALAGLGSLPATIRDRSIIVRMRPPTHGERPAPWRRRDHAPEAEAILAHLTAWTEEAAATLTDARPSLPPGIVDRRADVWEPLIAIADAAGGTWPRAARDAALWFLESASARPISWGVQLLGDLRTVFDQRPGCTYLWTADLLTALRNLPESAWDPAAGGHELTPRTLARMLSDYDIRSRDVREGNDVRKGYTRSAFLDAWDRHLPDPHDSDSTDSGREHDEQSARRRNRKRGRRGRASTAEATTNGTGHTMSSTSA